MVISNIFYFYPDLGKSSNLTNIFQMGRNHQLGYMIIPDDFFISTISVQSALGKHIIGSLSAINYACLTCNGMQWLPGSRKGPRRHTRSGARLAFKERARDDVHQGPSEALSSNATAGIVLLSPFRAPCL